MRLHGGRAPFRVQRPGSERSASMGVPLFFGWLRRRYPGIVTAIVDLLAEDGLYCAGSAQVCICAPTQRHMWIVW